MSKRVTPAERLHAEIDEVFAGGQDLAGAIERQGVSKVDLGAVSVR